MSEQRTAPWWTTIKMPVITAHNLKVRIESEGTGSLDTLAMKARMALRSERSLEAADTLRLIAAVYPEQMYQSSTLLAELHKYLQEPDAALQLSLVRVLGLVAHPSSEVVIQKVATSHLTVKNSRMLSQACQEALNVIGGRLDPFESVFINPERQ